jgi:hypothetical protein
MPPTYSLLLDVCGLSHREAADLHRVRIDSVNSWASGRRNPPDGALNELVALAAKIERAAAEVLAQIAEMVARQGAIPDVMELGLASDAAEAQTIGWPCVGAQRACLALIVARGMRQGYRFCIVPRGSTAATAAAADAHDQRRMT